MYSRINFPKRIKRNIDFSNYQKSKDYTQFFNLIVNECSRQDYILDQSVKKYGSKEIVYKCRGTKSKQRLFSILIF
jgi:hypothetical protein